MVDDKLKASRRRRLKHTKRLSLSSSSRAVQYHAARSSVAVIYSPAHSLTASNLFGSTHRVKVSSPCSSSMDSWFGLEGNHAHGTALHGQLNAHMQKCLVHFLSVPLPFADRYKIINSNQLQRLQTVKVHVQDTHRVQPHLRCTRKLAAYSIEHCKKKCI